MVGTTLPPVRRARRIGYLTLAALVLIFEAAWTRPALSAKSAVIFMYHRFGEDSYPTTNVRMEQFRAHLKELSNRKYHVMGVPEILAALRAGKELPDRAIGITVDDAFKSVYTSAWPLLRESGVKFTLFVSTGSVDKQLPAFMTWDEIRDLKSKGVTIGSHTVSHAHLPLLRPAQSAGEINRSIDRLTAELGAKPDLFAYPYGETSLVVRKQLRDAGLKVAFGQHSGVVFEGSDLLNLPRFALNETYGSMDRFRLAANALPLKVKEVTPREVLLTPATNPPRFGFTVYGNAVPDLRVLACYASGQGKTKLVRLGKYRVETRMERKFSTGRTRINCTMPATRGRWRWFGMQFLVPRP